ncbi:MAG TPA: hypothetical protein VFQ01_04520 [Nocardioides sp.]|jgi:hypothetical protein|nr:hypothetical protein [Nocardioides sp.]
MKVYRLIWWSAVAAILLIGLGVGLRLPPPALAAFFLGFGGLCAVVIFCVVSLRGSHTACGRVRIASTGAVLGGTTAVSLVGFSHLPRLLGAGVVTLVLLLSLCSPGAVRAVRRGLHSVHRPSATRLEALTRAFSYADLGFVTLPTPPPGPWALTDEQLSRGWQTSARTLRRRISPAQKVAVVRERQRYLEEFERRNPTGFEAWLTSSSGDSDDLMPYLSEGGAEHATINWDELTRGRD